MEPVAAWAAYVGRVGLEYHPMIWVRHWDIWDKARGEMGVPVGTTSVRVAAYACLVPFMLCPEIRKSELVYDDAGPGWLSVVTMSIYRGDILTQPRRVEYSVTDNGRYRFSEPEIKAAPEEVWSSVTAALQARSHHFFDDEEYTFEQSVKVAKEMVVSCE